MGCTNLPSSYLFWSGRAVASVVRMPSQNGDADTEWTDEKNNRRCRIVSGFRPRQSTMSFSFPFLMLKRTNDVFPASLLLIVVCPCFSCHTHDGRQTDSYLASANRES